jgi:dTDP-4-amino-4,6-dideoxygalactose transaminase
MEELDKIGISYQAVPSPANPSFWIFTLLVDRRDDFVKYMDEHGVATNRVHERNDKHSFAREFRCQLPGVDEACKKMICIPVGWWVTTEDREHIINCIRAGW